MTSRHTNPAIYAGLAGAAAWAAPTCASALTVFGTEVPISEPALSFIAGCVAGAVVASGTSLAINHAVNSRREREAAEQALAAHARSAKAARNRDAVKRLEEREAYLAARAAQEKGAAHVAYPQPAGQQQRPQQPRQQVRPQAAQQTAPQGPLQQQMAARAAAQRAAQQQTAPATPAQRARAAAQRVHAGAPAQRAQQAPAERAARQAEAAREAAIAEAQLKVKAAQAKADQARKAAERAQNAVAHQADVYAARQAAAYAAQQAAYVAQGMHVPGVQQGIGQKVAEVGVSAREAAPAQRAQQPREEQHHEAPHAAEAGRPRHAARSTVRADATGTWDKTGDIRVQAAPNAPRAKAQKQGPAQAAPQQGKPRYTVAAHYGSASTDPGVSAAWEAWQTGAGANNGADYLDVAEEYVNRITLKDRMAQRAKGVAGVLSERLGASKMEGLPVIARADGSVGDVGESWWNDAMGDDVRAVADGATGLRGVEESMLDNSAVLFTAQTREQAQAAKDRWQAQQRPQQTQAQQRPQQARPAQPTQQARTAQPAQQTGEVAYTPRTDRAAIAGRLADPKVVFPDQTHHWSDEQQDLWNVALNALDERTAEQVAMGAAASARLSYTTDFSTLDEPDHMEPATQFMSFKPQGGKPEVVDAESYVDMLLDQELAKSDSEAVRKLAQHDAHEYFRVVDGGTADIAPKPAPAPHHVAL